MKRKTICGLVFILALTMGISLINPFLLARPLNPLGTAFVQTAAAGNIILNWTISEHPLLNNQPSAVIFATSNWNPGGAGPSVYNDHATGVYYDIARFKWSVFNQDKVNMPVGAAFNILVPPVGAPAFIHAAAAANVVSNGTYIDNPLTNNRPDAILLVTPNWNPGGISTGTDHNHPIGVYYDARVGKWKIFNQDRILGFADNASFNIYAAPVGPSVFIHRTSAANTSANCTFIDSPLTNNHPGALVFVTPRFDAGGSLADYNPHHIGVWYTSSQKWSIYEQDRQNMPVGTNFNVFVIGE